MKKKKQKDKFWFLGIGLFLLFVIFNSFVSSIHTSEIASFGASLGILNGQVPYRDFLFTSMPLYHFLMSFFLLFSQTYKIYIIVHSIFAVVAYWVITKITKKGHPLFFAFLLLVRPSSYLFIACLLLMIIRMELERKKYYQIRFDYWIGALTSCVLLTNIWLGILLSIVLFQTSHNKKNRFLGWLIPIVCGLNYFFLTNSFTSFLYHLDAQIPVFSFRIYTVFGFILLTFLGIERYRMRILPNNAKILSIAMIMTLSVIFSPSATTLFLSLIFALLYFLLAYREEEYGFFANIGGYMYLATLVCFAIIMFVTETYSFSNTIGGFQNTILKAEEKESLLAVKETLENFENVFIYSASYPYWKYFESDDNWYDLYSIISYYKDDFLDELITRCQDSTCIFLIDNESFKPHRIDDLEQILVKKGYQQTSLFSFSVYKTGEKDFS